MAGLEETGDEEEQSKEMSNQIPGSFRMEARVNGRESIPTPNVGDVLVAFIVDVRSSSRQIASGKFSNDVNIARRYMKNAVAFGVASEG